MRDTGHATGLDATGPAGASRALRFEDDGSIPNSRLPLLVYPGVVTADVVDKAVAFETLFARHGWGGAWRNGIYGFHHYHSTAHEVLGIAAGEATVRFGGEHGRTLIVRAGDAVVIPAGVGHRNLGATPDLLVIGAYPAGQRADLLRGNPGERAYALASIAAVRLPDRDPATGMPMHVWTDPVVD